MRSKTLLAVLAAGLFCSGLFVQKTQAIPITGTIDMSGTAILDNTALGSATKANSFTGVSVGGIPTGSFTGTGGSSVTWTSFGWNPATTPVNPLWTFTQGALTYSFSLSSVSVVSQSNTFLNLLGAGTLSITGVGSPYTPTAGAWSFTISNPTGGAHENFAFTFANSQTAVVPDGGSSVALLGIALAGVEAVRRKIRARKS